MSAIPTQGRPRRWVVKSGCVTCKARRVKCDETWPHCQRCSRFGRQCGGYLSPTPQKPKAPLYNQEKRDFVPNIQAKPFLAILPQPVEAMPLTNELEARYFRVFQEDTSHELAGAFHLSFWDKLVLQACRYESFARHAVVALGALNMSYKAQLLKNNYSLPVDPINLDEHYRFALVQYDRAIKCMRLSISDLSRDLWKALLSCLLVYCFESFQGRKDLALSHAQSGQKLLQDQIVSRIQKQRKGVSSQNNCVIGVDIIHGFVRLDLLLLTGIDNRTTAEHRSFAYEGCTTLSEMPKSFKTIADAKVHLELLMRKIGHFMASALSSCDPTSPIDESGDNPSKNKTQVRFGVNIYTYQGAMIYPNYYPDHAERTADLRRWFDAAESLIQDALKARKDVETWQAMARLQIHASTMKILLAGALFNSEMAYDRFLPDFKAIVFYASQIFRHNAKTRQAGFNFDLALIPPVEFVGLCCRDWRVRREALALLTQANFQQEVFVDNGMLEAQVRLIMEMEEGDLAFGEEILEARRARILSVAVDDKQRSANVRILQKGEEGFIIKEKVIRW